MIKLLIGVDILLAAVFAWKFQYLPNQIPLLYSRPWGEAQIVDYWFILLLPLFMHIFFFINHFIAQRLFSLETITKKLFAVANIIIIVLFSAIFIKILFLVT